MAGFDAGKAVDPLDYDFTAYVDGCKGRIAEPSQPALESMLKRVRQAAMNSGLSEIAKLGPDPSTEQIIGLMGDLPEDALEKMMEETAEAVIDVCNGQPSAEEINRLPGRVRQAFIGWVVGELGPTKPQSAGMRRSPAAANGAAPST